MGKSTEKKKKIVVGATGILLAIILLFSASMGLFAKASEASSESSASSESEIIDDSASVSSDSTEPSSDSLKPSSDSAEPSSDSDSATPDSAIVSSEDTAVSSEIETEEESEEVDEILPPAVFAATDDTVTVTKDNFLEYFSVNGNASFDSSSGIVTLTPNTLNQAGTASLKVKISQKQSFELSGEMNLGDKGNSTGADGIAIGFHTGATTAVGYTGAGLGVAGLPNSLGVKWDTYYNAGDPMHNAFMALYYTDPSTPSITTLYNVGSNGPVQISEPSGNTFIPFSIIYDGDTQVLSATYNGIVRSAKIGDLQTGLSPDAALTLIMSAGTGSSFNLQQIKLDSFKFTPVGVINEYYVDEAGNTLYASKQSSASVPAIKGETLNLTYLNGTTDQPYIDGYDYVKSTQGSLTGTAVTGATFPFTNTVQSVYHIFKEGTGTVTYVSNDLQGNALVALQTSTQKWGLPYSVTPPTVAGYTYIGLASGSAALSGTYEKATKNVVMLFAKNLNVKFESNGGSSVATINVLENNSITAPTDPTKTGYTFGGWYTDSALKNKMDFSSLIKENMTLYAMWNVHQYNVVFDGNTHTGGNTASQAIAFDAQVKLNKNGFVKDGHTFTGWNTDVAGAGTSYNDEQKVLNLTNEDGKTITMYAQWSINSYKLTFDSQGGDTKPGAQTLVYDTLATKPSDPFKYGNTFLGWSTQAEGGTLWDFATDKMPGKNVTLYAQYQQNPHTVTFVDNFEKVAQDNITVPFGTKVPEPSERVVFGYGFLGWFDETGKKWDFNTLMPDNDITLTGKWYHVEYTLEYQTYDLKTISSHVLYAGDAMPTEEVPYVGGHHFVGWVIEGTDTKWNVGDTMPERNLVLVATYDKDSSDANGSGTNGSGKNGKNGTNSGSPKTGDNSNLVAFASVFGSASVLLVAVIAVNKKKKKNK